MSVKEYLFTRLRFNIVTVSSAASLDLAVAAPSNTMNHSCRAIWEIKPQGAMPRLPPADGGRWSKRSSNMIPPV